MYNADETQVGLANFLKWKKDSELQIKKWTKAVPTAAPRDLNVILKKCRNLSTKIMLETDNLALEVANKYENALAHLMHHWAAIDPEFNRKFPQLGYVEPKELAGDELAEHERMLDITKAFLIKVDRM